jgi:LDH2 family malate/lactate/ureidoglycolate dehydrogenase
MALVGDPPVPMVAINTDTFRELLGRAFQAAGVSQDEASIIAASLTDAELCEVPTHGTFRVPGYLRGLASGRFNPAATVRVEYSSPVAALVNGDNALGYLPATVAVREATSRARESGIGLAAAFATNEFGRAAFYARQIAGDGFVSIVCQNTVPLLGGPGSAIPTHGNNPFAYATPGPDGVVFDAAWTPRSGGEIGRRRLLGLSIPEEWGYKDQSGAATTDPSALAATLPAVGGAKGFGMAILVDLLAAGLTGASANVDVPRNNSQVGIFVAALSPGIFGAYEHFTKSQSNGASAVREAGARWPGDRSEGARERNLAAGRVLIAEKIFSTAVEAVAESDPGLASEFRAAARQTGTQ